MKLSKGVLANELKLQITMTLSLLQHYQMLTIFFREMYLTKFDILSLILLYPTLTFKVRVE